MTKTLATILLSATLAFGCSKKSDAPASADKTADKAGGDMKAADKPADKAAPAAPAAGAAIASDDDYFTKGKAFGAKMIDVFKTDGKDCDKIAADMGKLMADPDFASIKAYEKAHPDAEKKFNEQAKDMMKAFETAATPAIEACKDNKALADVMSKMD